MLTPRCPIQRSVWGVFVQVPVAALPKGLSLANGMQAQMTMQRVDVFENNHELRCSDPMAYEFYCVYCGQIGKQIDWVAVLSQPVEQSSGL